MTETPEQKLARLQELREFIAGFEERQAAKRKLLDEEKQKLVDGILTPELLAQVREIEVEFQPKYASLDEPSEELAAKQQEETMLTAGIKYEAQQLGKSIPGPGLTAQFGKGRVFWDDAGLLGYAKAGHPEILDFRKEGDPVISIVKSKK